MALPSAAAGPRPQSSSGGSPGATSSFLLRDGRLCGLHSKAQGTFLLSVTEQRRTWSGVFRHRHLLKDRPAASYQSLFDAFQRAFESGEQVTLSPRAGGALSVGVAFVHLGIEHRLELALSECTDGAEREAFTWHLLVDLHRAVERARAQQSAAQAQLATVQRRAVKKAPLPQPSPERPAPPQPEPPPAQRTGASPSPTGSKTKQGHPPRRALSALTSGLPMSERWKPVNATRPALINRPAENAEAAPYSDPLCGPAPHARRVRLNAAVKAGWSFGMTEGKMRLQQKLLEQQAQLMHISRHGAGTGPQSLAAATYPAAGVDGPAAIGSLSLGTGIEVSADTAPAAVGVDGSGSPVVPSPPLTRPGTNVVTLPTAPTGIRCGSAASAGGSGERSPTRPPSAVGYSPPADQQAGSAPLRPEGARDWGFAGAFPPTSSSTGALRHSQSLQRPQRSPLGHVTGEAVGRDEGTAQRVAQQRERQLQQIPPQQGRGDAKQPRRPPTASSGAAPPGEAAEAV